MKKIVTLLLMLLAVAPLQAQVHFTDLPDTLQVEPDTKYAVHWSVSFSPVVGQGSATMELLEPMFNAVRLISETENFRLADNSLLYEQRGCTMADFIKVGKYIHDNHLPAPYEWFIGLQKDETLVLGIKDTSDTFKARVAEASVHLEPLYDNTPVVSFRLDNGEPTETTEKFKDFSTRNLFKIIATEIDGTFVMAPRLNSPIESGAIAVSSLPVPLINKLFRPDPTTELEEVIIDCPNNTIGI